ncbi:MAG: UPF0149 family protein [Xanthomonadales bacterium]|nr:UPF0149 family protein [Xanthomonadales bacterium]
MDDARLPDYHDIGAALRSLQIAVEPSELHGALAGFICGGGSPDSRTWIRQLQLEGPDIETAEPLRQLFDVTCAQLADPSFGFLLLLPEGESTVTARADAMVDWVRGFLGGFGLAAGPTPGLTEDAQEALTDLGHIASTTLDCDDPEHDEESLTEVCEFVRVAALLLLHDGKRPAPGSSSVH